LGFVRCLDIPERREAFDAAAERIDADFPQPLQLFAALMFIFTGLLHVVGGQSLTMIVARARMSKTRILLSVFLIAAAARSGELRVLTTHHYRIHTDLDSALAEEIARRMDAMYEDYSRRLDDFAPGAEHETLLVSLFAKRADYCAYTGNRFPNTGGVFLPTK